MGVTRKVQRYAPEAVAGGLCHRRLLNVDRRRHRLTLAWAFSDAAGAGGTPDFGVALLILDATVLEFWCLLLLPNVAFILQHK